MTKIELTDEEAEFYLLARKHEDQIKVLALHGMFEPFIGSKTIHKNGSETVQMVVTNLVFRI